MQSHTLSMLNIKPNKFTNWALSALVASTGLLALTTAAEAKDWDHCLTENGLYQCVKVIDTNSANVRALMNDKVMFDIYITCKRESATTWNSQWIGRYNSTEITNKDDITQYSTNFCGGYLGYTE